jgi:Zn-dependent protease with chaperone function
MRERIVLVMIILAVPAIAFGVAKLIQAQYNHELRQAVQKHLGSMNQQALASISLDKPCENPDPELREVCSDYNSMNLMAKGAVLAAVLGLALVGTIKAAGYIARSNRRLLLALFKPGLYLTVVALIVLVLLNGALAVVALYYGESALIGRVHVFIIGGIGLGAVIGVGLMADASFSIVRRASIAVLGKSISREDSPTLWKTVDDVANKIGANIPKHIVAGFEPNFFVTEANVRCIDGELTGETMYVSLPLSRVINIDELRSIIGHELAHYKGLDTQFSEKFYPVYRGTIASIAALHESGSEGARIIALLPAMVILGFFLESFAVAENRISRERELAADQEGVRVSDRETFGSALLKIHAFSGYWQGIQLGMQEALEQEKVFRNASAIFAGIVNEEANPQSFEGLADHRMAHPTDSHPPLTARLDALGLAVSDIKDLALSIKPQKPAIDLIEGYEGLEEEITAIQHILIAREIGIDLPGMDEDTGRETEQH